ncbi:hypothetical protein [Corynebacterium sp. c25Ua_89]|uniref:hypothetical protein n=1 Tax=Corynebacterium sp. c25Ua_89 TaxID=3032356 RepID=UPI0039C48D96
MAGVKTIHIDESVIDEEGKLDILKIKPIARMGYFDYTVVTEKIRDARARLRRRRARRTRRQRVAHRP